MLLSQLLAGGWMVGPVKLLLSQDVSKMPPHGASWQSFTTTGDGASLSFFTCLWSDKLVWNHLNICCKKFGRVPGYPWHTKIREIWGVFETQIALHGQPYRGVCSNMVPFGLILTNGARQSHPTSDELHWRWKRESHIFGEQSQHEKLYKLNVLYHKGCADQKSLALSD